MALPPAGWYSDVQATGGERYWDGKRWTTQRRATPVGQDPVKLAAFGDSDDWADRWVWLLPSVGFFQGVRMLDERPARGVQLMLMSLLVTAVYVVVVIALVR